MILRHLLTVACLAKSSKKRDNGGKDSGMDRFDNQKPGSKEDYYFGMNRAERERRMKLDETPRGLRIEERSPEIPIVFHEDHEFGTEWESGNLTSDDTCIYTTQERIIHLQGHMPHII